MSDKRYAVDWADEHPRIVLANRALYEGMEMTFAEAKRKVIDHYQVVRDEARDAIRETRALKASDIGHLFH